MNAKNFFTKKENQIAFFSGLAGALANNYPHQLWWLCLFFLVPVFYLLHTKNNRAILVEGFIFSFTYIAVSFFWFLQMYPVTWMGISNSFVGLVLVLSCWFILCFFISLPFLAWYYFGYLFINKEISVLLRFVFVGASFVVFESLRSLAHYFISYGDQSLFGIHFTYHFLGYLASWSYLLSPLLSFGGIYLASFGIVIINYLFFYTFFHNKGNYFLKVFSVSIVLAVIVFQIWKASPLQYIYKGENSFVKVGLVTTDIISATSVETRSAQSKKILENFQDKVDVLVFPEASSLFFGFHNVSVPVGLLGAVILSSRQYNNNFNIEFYSVNEKSFSYYKKQLLMPQGEFLITWIKDTAILLGKSDWVQNFEYTRGGDKDRSGTYYVYSDQYSKVNIGALLCSEIISPVLYRNLTLGSANLLINLASHGTFHGSGILFNQNLSIAKTRAIENNRYFLQATNMNPSFVINNFGEIETISTSTIIANVKVLELKTLYTRYGDYILYISYAVCFLLLSRVVVRRRY